MLSLRSALGVALVLLLLASPEAAADPPSEPAQDPPPSAQAEQAPVPQPSETPSPSTGEKSKKSAKKKSKKKSKKKRKKRKGRRRQRHDPAKASWLPVVLWRAEGSLGAGFLGGLGVRRDVAGMLLADVKARPGLAIKYFVLQADLGMSHRQTLGASLNETNAQADVSLGFWPSRKLRVELEGGLGARLRPGWPDLYQPLADGGYAPTDRHSHWDRRVGLKLMASPWRHHHARVKYHYTLADYTDDPAFQAYDRPNHLAPFDHIEHRLRLSWRYLSSMWKLGAKTELFWRQYGFLFARDAGTGLTHASAGGAPPNPLQVLQGLEPEVSATLVLWKKSLEVGLGYGLELTDDPFQGYYSRIGHHPYLELEWRPLKGLELSADVEARLRTYGDGGYAAGRSHPALRYGDRRVDNRFSSTVEVSWSPMKDVTLFARAHYRLRDTNFPAYKPGVFPAQQSYDIDWSYQNVQALAGVAFEH